MKILFITHYYEPDSGAAAVRLTRLARLLQARGHEVTVLTTMPHYPQGRIADDYRGKFSTDEKRDGLRVVQVWLWATPSNSIVKRLISQISFMLTGTLRGLFLPRPDVIFIENQPIFTGLAGWFLSRVKRRPYLLNVSDFWPEYLLEVGVMKETHPLYRLFRALVNLTQRGAAALVALLPGLLQSVAARIGPVKNGRVIFNAVDLQRFRPGLDASEFRRGHGLAGKRVVLFAGTFANHIDFETTMDAAARLRHREDLRFVFAGTGIQQERIQQRLAQGDLEHTVWTGWLAHEEMPLAWAAADLSAWGVQENDLNRLSFQSKLYEAFASGTPLAVAVEGLMADVITEHEAGLAVPFGDSAGLAAAIERLLDDDALRARAAANARAYAEANFDAERVADAYEALLRGIAKAQP